MSAPKLALLGGRPAFGEALHVAQINLPDWERLEAAYRGILLRRRYANHGPLVRELETRLAALLGVGHVVCVANGTVALMILARALGEQGEVVVTDFSFPATAQALSWAGLTPVFCDVDRASHMLTAAAVRAAITQNTVGILGAHLWGRPCEPEALEALAAEHGLFLMFDACHAFACRQGMRWLGSYGRGEAFSFHATKVLNSMEGGCVTTDDADLAARIRTLRSFHDEETLASAGPRMNAKMSEAQAAMGLLSLDDLPRNIAANRARHATYAAGLAGIPGLRLIGYDDMAAHNHQYVVLEVDAAAFGLSRDQLLHVLELENVLCRKHFHTPLHRLHSYRATRTDTSFPVSEILAESLLQLPNGQGLELDAVARICGLIRHCAEVAPAVRRAMEMA